MPDIGYYLELPYTYVIVRDNEGDFVGNVKELEGCIVHGRTRAEVLERLDEAKELWIRERLESGYPVPEPESEEALPSGKWVQRTPRSLHKKLTQLAAKEGVSLNQLVTSILAEAVGERTQILPELRASTEELADREPYELLTKAAARAWAAAIPIPFMGTSRGWKIALPHGTPLAQPKLLELMKVGLKHRETIEFAGATEEVNEEEARKHRLKALKEHLRGVPERSETH